MYLNNFYSISIPASCRLIAIISCLYRYVFTVSTNILMFIIAWLVFRGVRNNGNMGSLVGPNDSEKFQVSLKIYRRSTIS